MKLTFRWFGAGDPVPLSYIRQIPCIRGIVSAAYDVPVGQVWSRSAIADHRRVIEHQGFAWSVVESLPVHESIKLADKSRDHYIENYIASLRNLAAEGIHVVCYNFMPLFDWTRTSLDHRLADGSFTLAYDHDAAQAMTDPQSLPGWDSSWGPADMQRFMEQYRSMAEEDLWRNLEYFLRAVAPEAAELGVQLAIHPDDPPWSVFGLPRIITDERALQRVLDAYDHASNGLCFCTGSLGAREDNDIVGMIRRFGISGRVHFVHLRNVERVDSRSFYETGHMEGSLRMPEIVSALREIGYQGPARPDHGRQMWGETGKPGYGLYDRALGAMYLQGLWDGVSGSR